jgi:multidrug transporter EmrE-like cation transporter
MEQQPRDEKLWQLAKRRAAFQESLISFMVVSAICWAVWYFTAGMRGINVGTPWPLWVMLGLGIAVGIKFIRAYKTDTETLTEQEYNKLKNKQQ